MKIFDAENGKPRGQERVLWEADCREWVLQLLRVLGFEGHDGLDACAEKLGSGIGPAAELLSFIPCLRPDLAGVQQVWA